MSMLDFLARESLCSRNALYYPFVIHNKQIQFLRLNYLHHKFIMLTSVTEGSCLCCSRYDKSIIQQKRWLCCSSNTGLWRSYAAVVLYSKKTMHACIFFNLNNIVFAFWEIICMEISHLPLCSAFFEVIPRLASFDPVIVWTMFAGNHWTSASCLQHV